MSRRGGRSLCGIGKRPANDRLRTPKMARDEACTFVAALFMRSKDRRAANLGHYAKRSFMVVHSFQAMTYREKSSRMVDKYIQPQPTIFR